jgi:transcriptional regulator with XRE-family HTH domain
MSTNNLKEFGRALKTRRILKGIAISDVAAAVGVKPSSMYAYEAGKYFPDAEVLSELSKLLEQDFSKVITCEGAVEEPSTPYKTALASQSLVIRMGPDLEMTVPVFGPDDRAKAMSDATAMIQKIRSGRTDLTSAAVLAIVADTAAKSSASPKPPAI